MPTEKSAGRRCRFTDIAFYIPAEACAAPSQRQWAEKKTPDRVGRIAFYSTRIRAFSIIFDIALQRDAQLSAVDDGHSRHAAIVEYIEMQPKSPQQQPCHCGSSGAGKEPRPVGRITCVSTMQVRRQRSCQSTRTSTPEHPHFYTG